MHINTTPIEVMENSLELGPKPSAVFPKFCGFSCCLPPVSQQQQRRPTKKIPDTTRTIPATPDMDDNDEIPQFFIDAVTGHDNNSHGIHQQDLSDNAFWKKLMSILWLLLAAKYWTGTGAADDGEKSLPPEINFDEEDLDFDGEEEHEVIQSKELLQ